MATKELSENAARDLGKGWKVSPAVEIKAHTTYTVAEIDGLGSIQHSWITPSGVWRNSQSRMASFRYCPTETHWK